MESPCCANICNRANPMLMYREPICQAHAPMGLDGDRFGGGRTVFDLGLDGNRCGRRTNGNRCGSGRKSTWSGRAEIDRSGVEVDGDRSGNGWVARAIGKATPALPGPFALCIMSNILECVWLSAK